jgi:hypothetical protein
MKFENSKVRTPAGNLILDSHKLSYHMDRVFAWESGERIAPVSVDMALTRACGAMCSFCYAMVQEPQERLASDGVFSFPSLRRQNNDGNFADTALRKCRS